MYKNKFPVIDEIVVVRVTEINEIGMYVELIEYNNISGLVQTAEFSKRGKPMRMHKGKQEVLSVIKVDNKTGYIDLSKRRVTQENREEALDRYTKNKIIYQMIDRIAEKCNSSIDKLYEMIIWKLSDHPIDDLLKIDILNSMLIPDDIRHVLIVEVNETLVKKENEYRCYVEVTCFSYEGIDGIKHALRCGKSINDKIEIQLVVSPLYLLKMTTDDEPKAITLLEKAMAIIIKEIATVGGYAEVKLSPHMVTKETLYSVEEMIKLEYKCAV
jgi:translation initiation factor 2 subunit 1